MWRRRTLISLAAAVGVAQTACGTAPTAPDRPTAARPPVETTPNPINRLEDGGGKTVVIPAVFWTIKQPPHPRWVRL